MSASLRCCRPTLLFGAALFAGCVGRQNIPPETAVAAPVRVTNLALIPDDLFGADTLATCRAVVSHTGTPALTMQLGALGLAVERSSGGGAAVTASPDNPSGLTPGEARAVAATLEWIPPLQIDELVTLTASLSVSAIDGSETWTALGAPATWLVRDGDLVETQAGLALGPPAIVPDPVLGGTAILTVRATIGNSSASEVELVGTALRLSRVGGGVTSRAASDNPTRLAASEQGVLELAAYFTPPLQNSEALTVMVEAYGRTADGRLVGGQSSVRSVNVVAAPPPSDSDGFGLSDAVEAAIGTNPSSGDSDGDLVDDAEEVGPTPLAPSDCDGDFVIDALDEDSDNGGEPDRQEALAGRDRCLAADDLVGAPLVVTTADDELDGGTTVDTVAAAGGAADLSLREAILIANNRGGADQITFDPAVFPATTPQTIAVNAVGTLGVLPDLLGPAILDGSGAGVIIDGGYPGRNQATGLELLGDNLVVRRLTLRNFARASNWSIVLAATDSPRLVLDTVTTECPDFRDQCRPIELNRCNEAVLVDAQVRGGGDGLAIYDSGLVAVRGAVVTDQVYTGIYVDTSTGVGIDDAFVGGVGYQGIHFYGGSAHRVRGSRIENSGREGVLICCYASDVLLDANTIRFNVSAGILVDAYGENGRFLANVISGNGGAGIVWQDHHHRGPRGEAPLLQSYLGNQVTGTTTFADGALVEVFVDDDGEGAVKVGEGIASGGAFTVTVALPGTLPGRQLTATVTDDQVTSAFSAPLSF